MKKERKTVEHVEQLENFPFKSFQEYKKASMEGVAQVGVDRAVALNWSYGGGLYASSFVRTQATVFMFIPFLAAIGFLVYIVMTGSWWLLLSLPVVVILYFMFHPSSGMIFGPIRTLLVWLTFGGLAYSFFVGISWLFSLTLTLALIWYGETRVYGSALKHLIEAADKHEDLFCKMWQSGVANLSFFNGDYYFVDHKKVGGEYVSYDE
ncbi:MAG: hypothetical protein WCV89_02265 [Candidatus Paceibacterota bacterium]|jgi:hypothetical protein